MSKNIINGITITGLLCAAAVYMPFAGFFCAFFIPLPVLFFHAKAGREKAIFIPLTCIILTIIMTGGITFDTLVFTQLLFIGFVLGELLRFQISVQKIIIYTVTAILGTSFLCILIYSVLTNTDIFAAVSKYIDQSLEASLVLYRSAGISESHIQTIAGALESIKYVIIRLIPAFCIVAVIVSCWLNLILAKPLFKKSSLFYPQFGDLKLWKAPDYLIWGVVGSGAAFFLPSIGFKVLGLNIIIVLGCIYFFQGIAIVAFLFEKKQIPRFLKIFIYTFIIIQQFAMIAVTGLGLFDTWFDFRKINIQNIPDKKS